MENIYIKIQIFIWHIQQYEVYCETICLIVGQ